MSLFLIIPLILALYLGSGTFIARSVNARERYAMNNVLDETKDVPDALNPIKHGLNCYRNPNSSYFRQSYSCDCSYSNEWQRLGGHNAETNARRAFVHNPYFVMSLWPVMGFNQFITGGTYEPKTEKTRVLHARIDELEAELGMEADK